jgi:hypothetical protein
MCLVLLFRFISLSIRCSKTKNHCVANDLSVTVISNRKCHENVCYLHHNVFLIFEQHLSLFYTYFIIYWVFFCLF